MLKTLSQTAISGCLVALLATGALAQEPKPIEIPMHLISEKGVGASVGVIRASETKNGFLRLDLDLTNELPPGGHGFHIHENGDCGTANKDGTPVAGLAAGGHYDPEKTGKHEGPSGKGHLGDLPILYVEIDEDGALPVSHSVIVPRLKLADIQGRSVMIHAESDNFSDQPKPLGGGGARIACGVVPK
ncbi:MAG TPA: superoxide dismutase [Cu-Zn] SodC [Hyphomicrobiaceae bacterium]|nr:superoxide dismutase [Cu-Zn] SodC [Hyphomicrobiaceae bacterium]